MYNVKITNNYMAAITVNGTQSGSVPSGGGTGTYDNLGNMTLSVPGMGEAAFIDLAEKKLDGYDYPTEYWGGLIRYKGLEVYFRYEGQGDMTVEFDAYGSMLVHLVNGTGVIISLPEFSLS